MSQEIKSFVGTKIVNALPMNLRNYNELRGWQLPSNEDGDAPGFLVEYPDSKPNTPDYSGYVSWSPYDEFMKAYVLIKGLLPVQLPAFKPHEVRLLGELSQMKSRCDRLAQFLGDGSASKLDQYERDLLQEQLSIMSSYVVVLKARVRLFAPLLV